MKFQGIGKVEFLITCFAIGLCSCGGPCSSWWQGQSSGLSLTQKIVGHVPTIGPAVASVMDVFITVIDLVDEGGDFQCIDDMIDNKIDQAEAEEINGLIRSYKKSLKYMKRNVNRKGAFMKRLSELHISLQDNLHKHFSFNPAVEKVNNFVFLAELQLFVIKTLMANDEQYDKHVIGE